MTAHKKSHKKKVRWGRVAAVWVVSLAISFAVTDLSDLPADVSRQMPVKMAYSWKDKTFGEKQQNPATIEPAAGEKGYRHEDRRELESLISRGAYGE